MNTEPTPTPAAVDQPRLVWLAPITETITAEAGWIIDWWPAGRHCPECGKHGRERSGAEFQHMDRCPDCGHVWTPEKWYLRIRVPNNNIHPESKPERAGQPSGKGWIYDPIEELQKQNAELLQRVKKLERLCPAESRSATCCDGRDLLRLPRLIRQSYYGTVRLTIGCMDQICQVTYYNGNREKQDIRGTSQEIADHINSLPNS